MASSLSNAGATPIVLVLITLSSTIYEGAQTPWLEKAVCRDFYADASSPPSHCKAAPVQARLAAVSSRLHLAISVQLLLLALFYAWLAGMVARRTILLAGAISTPLSMACFFLVCHLPQLFSLKAIYLTYLFTLPGGGDRMAFVFLFARLAEAVAAEHRAPAFFIMTSILLVSRVITQDSSAILLHYAPVLMFPAAVGLHSLTIPFILLFSTPTPAAREAHSAAPPTRVQRSSRLPFPTADREFLVFVRQLLRLQVFRLALAICFLKTLALDINIIDMQWANIMFGWTYAEVALSQAYGSLVCTLVLASLPTAARYFLSALGSKQRVELRILRLCLVARAVGAFLIGSSTSGYQYFAAITVYAFGSGVYDSFRSILTRMCAEKDITTLYTVIAMVETMAGVGASQIWPNVFASGLGTHGFSMAVPYWLSGCITASVLLMTYPFQTLCEESREE